MSGLKIDAETVRQLEFLFTATIEAIPRFTVGCAAIEPHLQGEGARIDNSLQQSFSDTAKIAADCSRLVQILAAATAHADTLLGDTVQRKQNTASDSADGRSRW